jgi:hypothetical protein
LLRAPLPPRPRHAGAAALGKLRRLPRIGLAGLLDRTRQEVVKRIERLGGSDLLERSVDAADAALDPDRFLPGVSPASTRHFVERFSGEARRLVSEAEELLEGRFDLLGYRGLRFGEPLDWHLDPVSGRRAPVVHWSRVDPLDAQRLGDSKVIWELNRHQWLVRLGQAYRLTGDERFDGAFVAHVEHWMDANPPGQGINWASSLELALRIVSWSWALHLFHGSRALTAERRARMLSSLARQARHVERYLSHTFSPNTHLTGEALGLVYAGALFPGLPRAGRWLAAGAAILSAELERQVLGDGVHFEQSTCYARYSVEIGLHFLIVQRVLGRDMDRAVADRVQRLLDFLLWIRDADGGALQIGDGDGGWLLPLSRREPQDLRGVFAVAAALFARSDYAWAAGAAAPEVPWLLGSEGLARFDALAPEPPRGSPSRAFPEGGYAVMSSGWDDGAHRLILDAGPLGCPVSAGHGHADLLAIQCSVHGRPFIVDPGTGTYADQELRDFFRGTPAHATLTVDGRGQADTAGPFAWRQRPAARLRRWVTTESYDFADGEHRAYPGIRHRRRVVFVKPRWFVVLDDVEGDGEHLVEVRFPMAPLEISVGEDRWVRVSAGQDRGLLLKTFARRPLAVERREGRVSAAYGRCAPAPVVVWTSRGVLPMRLLTLLLPVERMAEPPPPVSLFEDERGPAGLAFDGDRVVVSDAAVEVW